jgi:Right handed beta helix region
MIMADDNRINIVRVLVPGIPGPAGPAGAGGNVATAFDYIPSARHAGITAGTDTAPASTEIQTGLDANAGSTLILNPGRFYVETSLTMPSATRLSGFGRNVSVLVPTLAGTSPVIGNAFDNATPARIAKDIVIERIGIDGSVRSPIWHRWLSKSDDTPVTDPANDYVMGSGALASGISGVSLTAVLSGDKVASITVNNGGTGFKGHPTKPYLPNTVQLKLTGGGGFGAVANATISGSSIVSTTVVDGGYGYTTAPAVTTMGGYADISLLYDPSVNRRNFDCNVKAICINMVKVDGGGIFDCAVTDWRNTGIWDQGCRDFHIERNRLVRCTKNDQAFHGIWVQSFGDPDSPGAAFQHTENSIVQHNTVEDGERIAIFFSPTLGGVCAYNRIHNAGEGAINVPHSVNRDKKSIVIIRGNRIVSLRQADIVGHAIEAGGPQSNLRIEDNYFEDIDDLAITSEGNQNVVVTGNHFRDCYCEFTTPFGPFGERAQFNQGTMPIAGIAHGVQGGTYISVGSQGPNGNAQMVIRENIFQDTRATGHHPLQWFSQTKAGSNNIAQSLRVAQNRFISADPMVMLNRDVTGVWADQYAIAFENNLSDDRPAHPPRLLYSGGIPATSAAFGTDAVANNTTTYICEVFIAEPRWVNGIAVLIGTVGGGNSAWALANSAGRIVSKSASGSFAPNVYKTRDLIVPYAGYHASPGVYYVLVQFSVSTARFRAHPFGLFATGIKTGEVYNTFTDITPPTTFTPDVGPVAVLY